ACRHEAGCARPGGVLPVRGRRARHQRAPVVLEAGRAGESRQEAGGDTGARGARSGPDVTHRRQGSGRIVSGPFRGLSAQRFRPAVHGGWCERLPRAASPVHGASRGSASAYRTHDRDDTMARNFYAEINLHVTWHTKESAPLLVPQVEAVVHHYFRGRCINTPGVFIHEIGGIETHVHLAVSIAPTILISDFVGQLKGSIASSESETGSQDSRLADWLRRGEPRHETPRVGGRLHSQSAGTSRPRRD